MTTMHEFHGHPWIDGLCDDNACEELGGDRVTTLRESLRAVIDGWYADGALRFGATLSGDDDAADRLTDGLLTARSSRSAARRSIEDATYVARNWHVYGMPPGGLRDLSDEDLRARMRRVAAVDSERTG